MTIYSTHPSRGKIQILATYRTAAGNGVTSSTVTSVETAAQAGPVVDALNRVSACATVPVSVDDERDPSKFCEPYPDEHLRAVTDPSLRSSLLTTDHSLWYARVAWELYRALEDVETSTTPLPAPVRTAIYDELETDMKWLREALDEYNLGTSFTDDPTRRGWVREAPFVDPGELLFALDAEERTRLNRLERGASPVEVNEMIAGLRALLDTAERVGVSDIHIDTTFLMLSAEPYWDSEFYLDVSPPIPGDAWRTQWTVNVCQWGVDPMDPSGADRTGNPKVRCAFDDFPGTDTLALLVACAVESSTHLESWIRTPVGELLEGTSVRVTEWLDESESLT